MSTIPLFTSEGLDLCKFVYGPDEGQACYDLIRSILPQPSEEPPTLPLDEKDVFLITYGDSFVSSTDEESTPINHLQTILTTHLSDVVTNVHVLPFFPYTSDDGFSISDYYSVNPDLGTWEDLERIGAEGFGLACDVVLNHCSKSNPWFLEYLAQADPKYSKFFLSLPEDSDTSLIVRPRDLPLLYPFEMSDGSTRHIWCTFSEDQVDLNFKDKEVLVEFLRVLQFYISKGITVVRLDAIAYVWKELTHPSIHHPKTHAIVQLFRSVLNEFYPHILLLSETNVPHNENISYFGNGFNEAQMIYQFSLPPLTLYSFIFGKMTYLAQWASEIQPPEGGLCTYFNFLASHDGVGVTPLDGLMPQSEIDLLVEEVPKRGGAVSFKAIGGGGKIPYELNISYASAVSFSELEEENFEAAAKKFVASQAVAMTLVGVPAFYVHSMLGSTNWNEGVEISGIKRRINREKLELENVLEDLTDDSSFRSLVLAGLKELLRIRKAHEEFHPAVPQRVFTSEEIGNDALLVVIRGGEGAETPILGVINASREEQRCTVPGVKEKFEGARELISGEIVGMADGDELSFVVPPFGVMWIKKEAE